MQLDLFIAERPPAPPRETTPLIYRIGRVYAPMFSQCVAVGYEPQCAAGHALSLEVDSEGFDVTLCPAGCPAGRPEDLLNDGDD